MVTDSIFVIVPAFNEALVIRATVQSLLKFNYNTVVVDDGSTDGTWEILKSMPVYALRHCINLGQGAALQTGITFALRQGAAYIVHFDADGQHRAEEIESLVEPLRGGEAEVVLGSRFLRLVDKAQVPPHKQLILRGAVVMDWVISGLWLSDAHNGFRAMTRAAAQQIHLKENGFAHATELLVEIHANHLRWLEKPTHILYSEYSRSKGQSVWNALNIVVDALLRKTFQ